jgi:WD40 repeat protein
VAARFDAFISYSRSASSGLAVALRNGIERFAKPWYRLRSSRVFLDDATMSANTGLWSNIERGLTEADWFILLCSPKSAASQYVTTEITWWLEHKSADRILLVLDEGEMYWDPKTNDFDWKRSTAVNRALSKAFPEEPRWVEMPWFEAEGSLGTADPRFNERVADLASAIRGMERDELIGENVQQRRRALRLARGGVIALSALLVASLVATVIAVVNGNAAAEQARIALARQLAAQAITLSATDLQTASLLAVEAQRMNDDAQTRAALFQLATTSPQLVRTLAVGARVNATAVAADGTVFTGDASGAVSRWDGAERTVLADLNAPVGWIAVSDDGADVAAVAGDDAVRIVTPAGDTEATVPPPADETPATLVALSADGSYLAVSNRSTWLTLLRRGVDQGESVYTSVGTVPFGGRIGFGDHELTTFNQAGFWARISLDDASVIASGQHTLGIAANVFGVSRDGNALVGSLDKTVNYSIWNVVGSVSDGGTVEGDPADRVATSQLAGSLDVALDDTGSRLAVMDTGAIYVSTARAPDALPEPPIALLGAGNVNAETLTFRGDTLVNGTGDFALVWDLSQAGRITTQFAVPVPEGCTACGPQVMSVNDSGDRVLVQAISGGSPVAVDLSTGEGLPIDPDGAFGLTAAAWWDDTTFAVASSTDHLLYLADATTFEVADSLPIPLDDGVVVISVRADASTGAATVLADDGSVMTVKRDGAETTSKPFADRFPGPLPLIYGIAPDQSTAFALFADIGLRVVDVASGEVLYESADPSAAAYDGDSRLHVFTDGTDTVLDSSGAEVSSRPADADQNPPPALSADGRLLATGGSTGTLQLLDLARSGTVFGRIAVPQQENRFTIAAFSPDGSALILSTQEIAAPPRPSTVSRLSLVPTEWRTAVCAVAGRDLTADEWSTLIGTAPPADLGCDR